MPKLVTLGELLVEFVSIDTEGRSYPLPEQPGLFAGPFPSGAPAIFIDQAARMGVETAILGSIGADSFGDVLLRRLISGGTATNLVKRHPTLPTGTAHVGYNPDGSRDFVFHIAGSAAEDIRPEDVEHLLFDADALHISGATLGSEALRATALTAIETAKKSRTPLSFDPNLRQELMTDPEAFKAIKTAIGAAAWLFPSEDDLRALAPNTAPLEIASNWSESGKTVVMTQGAAGASLFAAGQRQYIPAPSVTEIDPTGAGDAFAATFVASLLTGIDEKAALALAVKAGANAVTKLGPMEGNSHPEKFEHRSNITPQDHGS